jgi:hypothetical protein
VRFFIKVGNWGLSCCNYLLKADEIWLEFYKEQEGRKDEDARYDYMQVFLLVI